MKIGIVAATNFEIQPTIDFLLQKDQNQSDHDFENINYRDRMRSDYLPDAGFYQKKITELSCAGWNWRRF